MSETMNKMTKAEFLNEIDRLGYRVDDSMSFCYRNNLNAEAYNAKSVYIVEKDSGLSFANIHARRDSNFEALQALRYVTEVIHAGRVWEV